MYPDPRLCRPRRTPASGNQAARRQGKQGHLRAALVLVATLASWATAGPWAAAAYGAAGASASGQLQPVMLGANYAPIALSCSPTRCNVTGSTPNGATFVGALNPLTRSFRVLNVGKALGDNISALVCPPGLSACIGAGSSSGIGTWERVSTITGNFGPVTPAPGTLGFDALACSSTGQCWLGGYQGKYPNFTSVFVPLSLSVGPTGTMGKARVGPKGQGVAVACPSSTCLGLVTSSTSSQVVVLKGGAIVASHPVSPSLHLGCADPVSCFAVGFAKAVPVNGATGVPGPGSPLPYKQAQGIACPSPVECVVAGYTKISASGTDASALSVILPGRPARTLALELPWSAALNALSCSSPMLCWVAGYSAKGGFVVPVPVAR